MFEATIIAIALLSSVIYINTHENIVKNRFDAFLVIAFGIYLMARFGYLLYASA